MHSIVIILSGSPDTPDEVWADWLTKATDQMSLCSLMFMDSFWSFPVDAKMSSGNTTRSSGNVFFFLSFFLFLFLYHDVLFCSRRTKSHHGKYKPVIKARVKNNNNLQNFSKSNLSLIAVNLGPFKFHGYFGKRETRHFKGLNPLSQYSLPNIYYK